MRWPVARLVFAVVLSAFAVGARADPSAAATAIALHDLDGREVHPFADPGRASAFVFVRTDCPISGRYAPEIERLQRRAATNGVGFWLVFVDPAQGNAEIRAHLATFGYSGPALRDDGHRLVALAGATITPEAAVFAPGGRLVYRGRIDDRYVDFGRVRPAPTRRDLDEVLTAVEAGRVPPFRRTEAIGCIIADLR